MGYAASEPMFYSGNQFLLESGMQAENRPGSAFFFSTPNATLAGNQWETTVWHVYVIAITATRPPLKGKRILI